MAPPEERHNSITRYHIVEENLVGSVKESVRDYDRLNVVMLCLGGGDGCDGVFKLLDTLLSPEATAAEKSRVLKDDFDISCGGGPAHKG